MPSIRRRRTRQRRPYGGVADIGEGCLSVGVEQTSLSGTVVTGYSPEETLTNLAEYDLSVFKSFS